MKDFVVCKHCLRLSGFDLSDGKDAKKSEEKKDRKERVENLDKNVFEDIMSDDKEKIKRPAKSLRYRTKYPSTLPPNPAFAIVDGIVSKKKKLIESGVDPEEAEKIALSGFDIRYDLLEGDISESDEDVFKDVLSDGKEDGDMSKLVKSIVGISGAVNESIEEAKVILRKSLESWEKDGDPDNDFQYFYQVSQLKRLIRDLKAIRL